MNKANNDSKNAIQPTSKSRSFLYAAPTLDPTTCYQAICTKNAQYDGHFFVGISSTGIYCRPICRVKTPKQEHCHFFLMAAQAEAAGFRPCMRCRPELAPADRHWSTEDAGAILACQAAALLDRPYWSARPRASGIESMADVAQKLGISDRHLRRVFERHWGITPLQYRQTQRLLRAKHLLVDSQLPMAQVATLSGFSSLRRFNDSFQAHYQLSPSRLREHGVRQAGPAMDGTVRVRLDYRPPLDLKALMGFLRQRALKGIETVGEHCLTRTIDMQHPRALNKRLKGWIQCRFDPVRPQVCLIFSESLLPGLHPLIKRVREAFDLDADPHLIHQVLNVDFPDGEGLRVPGAFDGFELAVRAVLGQQVTVAAGRTFAQRMVDRFGTQLRLIGERSPCLTVENIALDALKLFPKPQAIAQASSDALGALGIVKQRQAALISLAKAVIAGDLRLEPMPHDEAAIAHTIQVLCKLPGIGEWTAQYVAMRALGHRDALPAGDVALHRALGLQGMPKAKQQTMAHAKAWMPWRSYAVIRAWHSLALPTSASSIVQKDCST